jgi:hypothetical protein
MAAALLWGICPQQWKHGELAWHYPRHKPQLVIPTLLYTGTPFTGVRSIITTWYTVFKSQAWLWNAGEDITIPWHYVTTLNWSLHYNIRAWHYITWSQQSYSLMGDFKNPEMVASNHPTRNKLQCQIRALMSASLLLFCPPDSHTTICAWYLTCSHPWPWIPPLYLVLTPDPDSHHCTLFTPLCLTSLYIS